jgi:hypothetical protein
MIYGNVGNLRTVETFARRKQAVSASRFCQAGLFTMLEFDQNTLANITAALEWVCKRVPAGQDTPEVRKEIATAMIACAKSGRLTYVDFLDVGTKRLVEIAKPQRSRWFSWFRS